MMNMQITAPMAMAARSQPRPRGADVINIIRKNRQNRHRAAEQHGEQIQRDDAEDDFVLINKTETFDQAFGGNRFGGFDLVDVFDRRDEREAKDGSQDVQRIDRPRRAVFRARAASGRRPRRTPSGRGRRKVETRRC